MDMDGRASDARDLSGPPQPRGGRGADESSGGDRASMSWKGGKYGANAQGLLFPPKSLPKNESTQGSLPGKETSRFL